MRGFVRGDLCFVLEGQRDIVQAVQKIMPAEFVYGKRRAKTMVVGYGELLQIHRQTIGLVLSGAAEKLLDFVLL